MGALMKGHGGGSGNRGKQYGLMLFLAIGAAIFAVMVLHKLREGRVFYLLVKEKDRELLSLQLLLQKERDYKEEAKRKTREMKEKMHDLGRDKMDLESRILEMQSLISSLKDEQRTIESTLEEKQNEIKVLLLREKEEAEATNQGNPQVTDQTSNHQKESGVEGKNKQRVEDPVEVWSVSTDDPSNAALKRDKPDQFEILSQVTGGSNESTQHAEFENSSRGADHESLHGGGGDRGSTSTTGAVIMTDDHRAAGITDSTGEQGQKTENSRDEVPGDGDGDGVDKSGGEKSNDEVHGQKETHENGEGGLGSNDEPIISSANATEKIVNNVSEVLKTEDGNSDSEATDGTLDQQLNSRGGMKLEIPDNSLQAGAANGVEEKHGYATNPKGKKRRRKVARNRRHGERYKRLRDDELQRHRDNHDRDHLQRRTESGQGNAKMEVVHGDDHDQQEEIERDHQVRSQEGKEEGRDALKDVGEAIVSADVNPLKLEANNASSEGGNAATNHQTDERQEVDVPHEKFEKPNLFPDDDMQRKAAANTEADETAAEASLKKSDELRQSEAHDGGIQQQIEPMDGDKVGQISEEAKVADKNEEPEDVIKVAQTQEAEADHIRETGPKVEQDQEETEDDKDEPEF